MDSSIDRTDVAGIDVPDAAELKPAVVRGGARYRLVNESGTQDARESAEVPQHMTKPVLVRSPGPVAVLPTRGWAQRAEGYLLLQSFEGYVIDVKDDTFSCRLIDRTHGGRDKQAVISFDEVSESDRSLIEPGAVFYWSIGYHDSKAGQRRRVSDIIMRRLPVVLDNPEVDRLRTAWLAETKELLNRATRGSSAEGE